MLQKDPLPTPNLRVDKRSEQPAEFEDRSTSPNLPLQTKVLNGSNSKPVETTDEVISQDISNVSGSHPFVESSSDSPTVEQNLRLNTNFLEELEQLENLVLESVRLPLTELVIIDEGLVLDQIESIRKQIPREMAIAINILQRKREILQQAQEYARKLIESANQQAERIIQKSALLRQAELEATRIKVETQRECQQLRRETQEEIEQWREYAIAEYQDIQQGADEYAKKVLGNLEGQLGQMLGIIRNGYQQLEPNTVQDKSNHH
ncbi:MAG: DivIVA domain-containing protein [Xenococcaceae cyanobacterium MO_167.B52]|nr:DivIVA domain-containing protein [Xenococcaceae cyanobacterium MO_167.B52]